MVDSKTDLDLGLAALFDEEHGSTGDGGHPESRHIEPDELLAYLEASLPEEARRRIQDHLEACRQCTETLLDLETLAEPDEPRADGATDFELAAAWRTFQGDLGPAARVEPEPSTRAAPARNRWRTRGIWRAAAAVFCAATLGLSWQVARLQGNLTQRDAPQINVPVLYLEPTRAAGKFDARLDPGEDGQTFLVFLSLTEPEAFAEYQVDVLGIGEEPLETFGGLEASDSGSLRIALSRGFLAPGEYLLRLHGVTGDGVTGDGREPIDDYRIEVK